LKRAKTNDETLENLRRALDTRGDRLEVARAEVEQMLAARNQLIADVAKLEARQKMTAVAQSSSEFDLDTSVLARANQLVRDVETRLDVTERLMEADVQFPEQIRLDEPVSEDIAVEIAEYLQGDNAAVASMAAEIAADPQL
jgi:hypothetical protein